MEIKSLQNFPKIQKILRRGVPLTACGQVRGGTSGGRQEVQQEGQEVTQQSSGFKISNFVSS